MSWHRFTSPDELVLAVHVQPGAKSPGITGLHGDAVKIRLTSPPVDGKANEALLTFLADCFGVPRRQVTLEAGHQSRKKRVRIVGVSELPPALAALNAS